MTLPRNFPGRKNARRSKALERLSEQLKRGTKPAKRSHPFHNRNLVLSGDEQRRLSAEADTLALRITTDERARAIHTKKTKALGWSAARTAYRSGRL